MQTDPPHLPKVASPPARPYRYPRSIETHRMPSEAQDRWLEAVLGITTGRRATRVPPPPPTTSLVAFAHARLAWEAAKANVAARLATLRSAIAAGAPDPDSAALVTAAAEKLGAVLGRLDAGLGDALANATAADRAAALKTEVAAIVGSYLAYLETDRIIAHIETNPTGPLGIADTLRAPLTTIRTLLAAG